MLLRISKLVKRYITSIFIRKLAVSYITVGIYTKYFENLLTIVRITLYFLSIRRLEARSKIIIKSIEISS